MSKSLVPKASTWYMQNKGRIARICENNGWKTKELYHKILEHLSHTYNIGAARKIYRKEQGFYPPYAIDIVGYFPELAQMADAQAANGGAIITASPLLSRCRSNAPLLAVFLLV